MRRTPLEEGQRWLAQAEEDLKWANPEFADRAKKWSLLDGYYVAARYPNSLPESIPAVPPPIQSQDTCMSSHGY